MAKPRTVRRLLTVGVVSTVVFAALGGPAAADSPVGGDPGLNAVVGRDTNIADPSAADGDYATPSDGEQSPLLSASLADGEALVEVATAVEAGAVFVMDAVDVNPVVDPWARTTATETDAAGSVVSSLIAHAVPSVSATQSGQYACVLTGDDLKKQSVIAHQPSTIGFNDKGMDLQYQVHSYQANFARPMPSGIGWTWQVEVCMIGGAETFESWRLVYVANGVTAVEDYQSRIGATWESGTDLPKIDASLSMNVAPDGSPVTVGASASQKATGVNSGSKGTRMPQKSSMDEWRHNAALARWDMVCPAWQQGVAKKYCGSEDYQATITQTLYEWPRSPDHSNKTVRFGFWGSRLCGGLAVNCKK